MTPKAVHTKITIAADTFEILTAISKAYVADKLTPVREPNISGALQKAAHLYIAAIKEQNPELRELVESLERKHAEIRRAVELPSKIVRFEQPRRRGRPPKTESGGA